MNWRYLVVSVSAALLLSGCSDSDDITNVPDPDAGKLQLVGYLGKPIVQLTGLALDRTKGEVFLVESGYSRVLRGKLQSIRLTIDAEWGGPGSGPHEFGMPWGVAELDGQVFVTDTERDMVKVFSADGDFARMWGGSGEKNGQLDSPRGIACGPDGSVFVADSGNNRIQVFDGEGMWQSSLTADSLGVALNGPYDVAVGDDGRVHVCDTFNNRVVSYDNEGRCIGIIGSPPGKNTLLFGPLGIGADSEVIVADTGNGRLCWFGEDLALESVIEIFSLPYPNRDLESFHRPAAVAGDYVVDGNRMMRVDNTQAYEQIILGQTPGLFAHLGGVVVSDNGEVHVLDRSPDDDKPNRIQKFDQTGQYRYSIQDPDRGKILDLAVNSRNELHALLTRNVIVYSEDGAVIGTFGDEELDYQHEYVKITIDGMDQVLIAGQDTRDKYFFLNVFSPQGELLNHMTLDPGRWQDNITDLAAGKDGEFYLASPSELVKYDASGSVMVELDISNVGCLSWQSSKLFAASRDEIIRYGPDLEWEMAWPFSDYFGQIIRYISVDPDQTVIVAAGNIVGRYEFP